MVARRGMGAFLGAMMALSLGVAAQAGETVTVDLDGQPTKAPIPEGFCRPTPAYEARARQSAGYDKDNITLLALYRCDQMAAGETRLSPYIHMKFPISTRGMTASIADIHREMPDAPAGFSRWFEAIMTQADLEGDLTRLLGREADFTQAVRPVGEDETGAYLAGTMSVQVDVGTVTIAAASGWTVLNGRMVAFNVYGYGDKPTDVAAQLRLARLMVTTARAAN